MSVIFSNGKKSARKFKDGANKAKKTQAAVSKPQAARPETAKSYMPNPKTVVWNHKINGTKLSLALCKETMRLWCNDINIPTDNEFVDDGSEIRFVIQERKGLISIRHEVAPPPTCAAATGGFAAVAMVATTAVSSRIVYELNIDGVFVPEFKGIPTNN